MEREPLLQKYQWQISLVLLGLILVGLGVLGTNFLAQKEEEIEVLPAEEVVSGELLVDIQGAITNPGVYQLPSNSRTNDLLIKAGGLSSEADREWVAKNLNLAEKLTDGKKIYIPKKGEQSVAGAKISSQVNINTASSAELDKLWGIGPVTAAKIIDDRPYGRVEELLTKKILKKNVYERIKDQLTIF